MLRHIFDDQKNHPNSSLSLNTMLMTDRYVDVLLA